jgi:hypothetical protein
MLDNILYFPCTGPRPQQAVGFILPKQSVVYSPHPTCETYAYLMLHYVGRLLMCTIRITMFHASNVGSLAIAIAYVLVTTVVETV